MPDVWLRYIRIAEAVAHAATDRSPLPPATVDLLLSPISGVRPGKLAGSIRERLGKTDSESARTSKALDRLSLARVALSDSRVVARLDFETLIRDVVPLSGWWQSLFENDDFEETFDRVVGNAKDKRSRSDDVELSRYAALVGFIAELLQARTQSKIRELAALAYRLGPPAVDTDTDTDDSRRSLSPQERATLKKVYAQARRLMSPVGGVAGPREIFLISLNRPAAQSVFESRATVKADAALRVFAINTTGIAFAIIDGGIDATHPAFQKTPPDPASESSVDNLATSRVLKTYDFTMVRDIIFHADDPKNATGPNGPRIKWLAKHKDFKRAFDSLKVRNERARDIDWEIVHPLIEIPHVTTSSAAEASYQPPGTDHGTHVAGIMAASAFKDDRGRELNGMCPHLSLFDLRVFDANGKGDEFAILCAIEFVGWLNRDRATPVVHGVNLSLALAHDVDSFACGQTPICEACNHLVGKGTVVVAAAGNTGFEGGAGVEKKSMGSGYRAISITDPGNADTVITVGSTHRRDPHLYGVSYFSARGPTGDGRRKPDILAPGEKITSTIRDGGTQRMDGTSMAAPHVSGAAALLMARYPELIGRPLMIKDILMRTATDLKREPSFQGAGLVDVLRALQSV